MSTLRQSICKELKIIRANMRLKQHEVSNIMNLHKKGYGKIERCESDISIDDLEKLATELGYTIKFTITKH